MESVFLTFVNRSITAAWLVLAILAVRLVFRKAPKWVLCLLWGMVALRLICPVSIESDFSLVPDIQLTQQETVSEPVSEGQAKGEILDSEGNVLIEKPLKPAEQGIGQVLDSEGNIILEESLRPVRQEQPQNWYPILSRIWVTGILVMLGYAIVSFLLLKRKVATAIPVEPGIKRSEFVETPFVLGIIRPVIYLPSAMEEGDRDYVIAHERAHIRRKDHWWKPLGFLLLSLYWFNPILWLAYILLCRDIEGACDEKVIRTMEQEERKAYSTALLHCSIRRRSIAACPLAFGEVCVKTRVKGVMHYKKPGFWVMLIAVVLCLVLGVCFLTDPEEEIPIEELTRKTYDQPCGFGVGDLYFTYPAGLTHEMQEAEDWSDRELRNILDGIPNRGMYVNIFSDQGTVFGGIVDFIWDGREPVNLQKVDLPEEWEGLEAEGFASSYPCADLQYTLYDGGDPYIDLYVYTYSGRGYFLWFYSDEVDIVVKEKILASVKLGTDSRGKTKTEADEPFSLGQFNLTIPKGYGYKREERIWMEISKKERFQDAEVVAGATARPNLPPEEFETLGEWAEAIGISLDGVDYRFSKRKEDGKLVLTITDSAQGREERHYFFQSRDEIYDLWFDTNEVDSETEDAILKSAWVKDTGFSDGNGRLVTVAGEMPVEIGELPWGYNYGFDENRDLVFAWGTNVVGGVKLYPIPEGVYDPEDTVFHWLKEMHIPDFEDENLVYKGGITSGEGGWAAEFAGEDPQVRRHHTFKVKGDMLYDIWFDLNQISWDNMLDVSAQVHLPE